ncbi:hypothetical protein SAY87_013387 [Trapa incisa]|uniref:MYND-type domain-containing protein n=1 Tax=Trapa incisa TaxID=236973 RepID=A0AAN7KEZ6_9MYRT|nr:hypothetical protein SAY87_013387 [Trapa incisa]
MAVGRGAEARRGACFRSRDGDDDLGMTGTATANVRRRRMENEEAPATARSSGGKRRRRGTDRFDTLPDELVLSILCKLAASAGRPSDFINVLLTCKRLKELGLSPQVLSTASAKTFAVKAKNWSNSADRFLKLCADSGNVEASYTLGMIHFYCLQNRRGGASLMAKAAIGSHARALYSLAVIQFNGSGRSKNDKDLRAGVTLCSRAAFRGHIDAMRELGHCLQDGYGVCQDVTRGRRLLVHANARELAAAVNAMISSRSWISSSWANDYRRHGARTGVTTEYPLLSDYGYNVPALEAHTVNRFMTEWFAARDGSPGPGLRLCSHGGCGRPETRRNEFRRCSVCGTVNYCSRACQALDWKLRHKEECVVVAAAGMGVEEGGAHGVENDDRAGDGDRQMMMVYS